MDPEGLAVSSGGDLGVMMTVRNWVPVGWAMVTAAVLAVATILEVVEFVEVSSWPWPVGLVAVAGRRPSTWSGDPVMVSVVPSASWSRHHGDLRDERVGPVLLDPGSTLSLQREAIPS